MYNKNYFKTICFIFGILVLTPVISCAADFSWLAPPNPEWGTKIYVGQSPGNYTNSVDCGTGTTCTVDNLYGNTLYFFAATHYFKGVESEFSNEIQYTTPGVTFNPPQAHEVKTYKLTIEVIK